MLDTSHAKLEIEHMSDWWMVNLILRAEDVARRVEVEAGERLERFLQQLVLQPHELSLESWDSFVDELRRAGCIPGSFSTFVLELPTGDKSPLDYAFVYGGLDPVPAAGSWEL